MFSIKKIVVPIDTCKTSNSLVDYAMYYAKQFGATVTFVHVIENPMAYDGFAVTDFDAKLQEHVEIKMRAFIRELNEAGKSCEGYVVKGYASDEIIKFTKEHKGDLIIIGSHRYNVIEKLILGSVAEKVAHGASCPVVIYNSK